MVCHLVPAGAVHRRHVPAGHHRRLVHEFRLRLGVFQPVRKVYYNITITGLSVVVALLIGSWNCLGCLPTVRLERRILGLVGRCRPQRDWFRIVGLFVVTWAGALLIWRYGRIEEKWTVQAERVG